MAEQTYLKRDLIDYVDGSVRAPDESYSGRAEWVICNLPESASVQFRKEGGYDGKLAFVIRLDGYLWIFNDYYGSCSGCDSFLANKWDYTRDMLRKAYCFPDEHAAHQYVESTDDYAWRGIKSLLHEMIDDPGVGLRNPKTRFIVRRRENSGEKYAKGVSGLQIIHQENHD